MYMYDVTVFRVVPLQGLQLAQSIARSPDMVKVLRAGVAKRQREIVTPVLFETAMNGDADKLYCTLEEGDCVNPLVSGWFIVLRYTTGNEM